MTARPRRTTTLVGPNRLVLGAATAGLVALASAGTALLVLTGTSSVAPIAAPAPPLPSSSSPLTHAPGVVVLPAREPEQQAGSREELPPHRSAVVAVVPAALAFTDVPAPTVVPAVVPPVVAPELPALRRTPAPEVEAVDTHPGRHLAKGHVKHGKHPKVHGKRVGWSHSVHRGNR